ncbi:MAG: PepSY domain-containing protein [Cardiobacteriaceae bacterium]|nr:PepSY domain-containing protein [Cardiobacteriaceae bacterium]
MFNKTLLAICTVAICLNANAFTGLSDAIAIAEAEGGSAYMVKRGQRQNKDVFNVFIKTKQGTQLVSVDAASGEVLSQKSRRGNSAKITLQQAIAAAEKDGAQVEEAVLVGELPRHHGQAVAVEPFYLITANINGNRERIFISAEDGSRLRKPKMLERAGAHQHGENSHQHGQSEHNHAKAQAGQAGGHCEHHGKQAGGEKVEASAVKHQHGEMPPPMPHKHGEMATGQAHNHGNMPHNHGNMPHNHGEAAGHNHAEMQGNAGHNHAEMQGNTGHNHAEMMRNRSRENIDEARSQNRPPREMSAGHQHGSENKPNKQMEHTGGHCEHHGKQAGGEKVEASAVKHQHQHGEMPAPQAGHNHGNMPPQAMQHNHQH